MGERALSQEQNDLELLQPLDWFHFSDLLRVIFPSPDLEFSKLDV